MTRRSRQRGIGFIGLVFWLGLIGGAYVGISYFPVFTDDYRLKNVARGACNDYLARSVITAGQLEEIFIRKVERESLAELKPQVHAEVDERDFTWAQINVTYTRPWNLLLTKKTYTKAIKWTVRSQR
jgi:hypothetical protein